MRLTLFSGLVPKLDGQDLPPNAASVAENCDLYSGRLDPFPVPGGRAPMVGVDGWSFEGDPVTLYKAGPVWVAWSKHVFVVPDPSNRAGEHSFLYVEDGELRRSSATWVAGKLGYTPVGVAPPATPPQAVAAGGVCEGVDFPALSCVVSSPDDCAEDAVPGEIRAYIMTYVTTCGEESAPSPPTEPVVVGASEGVVLLDASGTPPAHVAKRRWYRALGGSDGQAIWLFVGESDAATMAFTDCTPAMSLGHPMDTETHLPPPACLDGVALLGDTSVAVWSGNQFWVSEPRLPHAYPPEWRRQVPQDRITAMVGVTPSIEENTPYLGYIVTPGRPYFVTGKLPEQVSVHEYAHDYPAVSARAWTTAEGAFLYASPYGLVALAQGSAQVLMDPFVTDVEWQELGPRALHLHHWNGRVWGFGPHKSFVLTYSRVRNDRPPTLVELTLHPAAAHAGPEGLMLALGSGLQKWGAGTGRMQARWRSKTFTMPGQWWPAALKVVADGYRPTRRDHEAARRYEQWVALHGAHRMEAFFDANPEYRSSEAWLVSGNGCSRASIWSGGVKLVDRMVPSNKPVRLPRRRRGIDWEFEIVTRTPVREVHLETSISDLTQLGLGVGNSV